MRLSLRTLLAFEDNIFDHEQHQQLERVIPQHDAALMTLNRIRSVMRNPRLGVPGLVDQREELDPNLVAEYLDHQMSEEIQDRFEAYCLSSDKYLAEIASIHTVLSNVLGEPARTSRECRLRCYDLYRQPTPSNSFAAAPFEEKRQKKNEQESFVYSSRQLFDDYLQSPQPFRKPATTETLEFPQRPVVPPERPELIPFSRQNETDNNSYSPQFSVFPASPSPTPAPVSVPRNLNDENRQVSGFENHWTTPADQYRAAAVVPLAAPPAAKCSLTASIWNWLTTVKPQDTKPEVQKEQREQKAISLKPLLLLLMLCAAALLGWNRFQHQKNSDLVTNLPPKEMTAPDTVLDTVLTNTALTNTVTPPVVVPIKKEEIKKPELPKLEPKKEEIKKPEPPKPEPKKEEIKKPELPKPEPKKEEIKKPEAPQSEPPKKTVDVVATQPMPADAEAPKKTTDIPAVAAETKKLPAPVIPTPVKEVASTEQKQTEKPVPFIPNPIRSGEPNIAAAKTEIVKPAEPAAESMAFQEQRQPDARAAVRAAVEQTFVKQDEAVRVESQTPIINPHETVSPIQFQSNPEQSKPLLIASPERKPEPFDEESIIAFQPITASPKQRESEIPSPGFVEPKQPIPQPISQPERQTASRTPAPDVWMTSVANQPVGRSEKVWSNGVLSNSVANEPPTALRGVTLLETNAQPASSTPNTSNVITVGEIRENNHVPHSVGRVLSAKEPCVVFSASNASDQWEMKRLPMELRADQYLLTTAPFRTELELEGGFRVEMVGDSKLCVLEPDENGVPGIFIDYGRLVIRPIASNNAGAVRPLRIQTEKVQGIVRLIGSKSLIFVDTFAEILENATGDPNDNHSLLPKVRPILGLLPDLDERISWQTDTLEAPLVATRQAGILLVSEKPELGKIQGLPNWLNRIPLPQEGEVFAAVCRRVFDEVGGNCEVALNRLIREQSISIRSFGYRLWGDLGRFDIPLSFLSEANPNDEPIRQVLVPYFREVMKRDEETVQRLADAIEAVRR